MWAVKRGGVSSVSAQKHVERGVDLDAPDWRALGAAYRLPVDTPVDADDLANVIARSAVSGEPRLVVYSATLSPPRSTSPRWADSDH